MAADNTTEDLPVYDESYTVTQLRTIAKSKGIVGYSTMTKTELLEVLNNAD